VEISLPEEDFLESLRIMLFAAVSFVSVQTVVGHGCVTDPPNRAGCNYNVAGTQCGQNLDGTHTRDACAWLTPMVEIDGLPTLVDPLLLTTAKSIADPDDTLNPSKTPWRNPGSVPVKSPCGNNFWDQSLDAMDLPPNPNQTIWVAGSNVKVASAMYVNHGGGWSYRLCPKGLDATESCFQSQPLKFVGSNATARFIDGREVAIPMRRTHDDIWSRNPVPAAVTGHDLSKGVEFAIPQGMEGADVMSWDFSIVEEVAVPSDLAAGEYLLSWRWDCEKSDQVWFTCSDIIVANTLQV
jgi:hypothetical protein